MEIEMREISVGEIFDGYRDDNEGGVVGYLGRLNIRPAFQREFVYKEKQRDAVVETINKGFPLNVMYWAEDDEGNYELLDGQQRTLSVCQYVNGDFSIGCRYFHNLTACEKSKILDYKLTIYVCRGSEKEKLDWFKIINIAGVQLKEQELRNAVYTGKWLSDAKTYFSKINCVAYSLANKYVRGDVNRQDYLETALAWIAERDGVEIEDYMATHQHDAHATPLWQYFQSVINWTKTIFPKYRSEMKGLDWGRLYRLYGARSHDPQALEETIARLMRDDDVTKRSGAYEFVLSGEEKHLHLRAFTENEKRQAYERQNGVCPYCAAENRAETHYELSEMEGDHVTPWSEGGRTNADNCQMLCKEHNRRKGAK